MHSPLLQQKSYILCNSVYNKLLLPVKQSIKHHRITIPKHALAIHIQDLPLLMDPTLLIARNPNGHQTLAHGLPMSLDKRLVGKVGAGHVERPVGSVARPCFSEGVDVGCAECFGGSRAV
jgi:hypothetical protein